MKLFRKLFGPRELLVKLFRKLFGPRELLVAALFGHEALVKALIEAGADVEADNFRFRRTPLLMAAWYGHEAAVKAMIEAGADCDKVDNIRRTPLFMAAKNGHEAVVKALIEAGADVDKADQDDWTPLFMAAMNGHEAVVKMLIEAGADCDKVDNIHRTPLFMANANGHEAVVRVLLDGISDGPYSRAITERTRLKRCSRRIKLCCLCCRMSFIPLLYVLQLGVLSIIIYGDTCGGDRDEFLNGGVQFNGSHIIHEDCTEDMENVYGHIARNVEALKEILTDTVLIINEAGIRICSIPRRRRLATRSDEG